MKTAIVCDWLVTYAGSEQVLTHILNCFPEADLFAVIDFLPDEYRKYLHYKSITTTYIQKFPGAKKYYRSYLPFMPHAIEQLDLSDYDLILSSSHAVAKGVITKPNQLHISYVHSPMRYAWDLQHQYLKESGLDKGIKGYITKKILHKMRLWDLGTASRVNNFIANSHYIAQRIYRAYQREATVIYPPIDLNTFSLGNQKEDFYLTASRMVPYKKIDVIVKSFALMPKKKLIVIGNGPDFAKIKSLAGKNVELLGYQPNEVLVDYMQRAKGFLFAAEEDFGLIPLEAQACGTPVIAFGRGGVCETVRGLDQTQPTGLFFNEQTTLAVCQAINEFEEKECLFTRANCHNHAKQFSSEKFCENFKSFVLAQTEK